MEFAEPECSEIIKQIMDFCEAVKIGLPDGDLDTVSYPPGTLQQGEGTVNPLWLVP
jgi:hypothetical protein